VRSARWLTSAAASSNRAGAVGSRGGGPGTSGLSGAIAARCYSGRRTTLWRMSPFWIWTQAAIVIVVLIGMVVAVVKLV